MSDPQRNSDLSFVTAASSVDRTIRRQTEPVTVSPRGRLGLSQRPSSWHDDWDTFVPAAADATQALASTYHSTSESVHDSTDSIGADSEHQSVESLGEDSDVEDATFTNALVGEPTSYVTAQHELTPSGYAGIPQSSITMNSIHDTSPSLNSHSLVSSPSHRTTSLSLASDTRHSHLSGSEPQDTHSVYDPTMPAFHRLTMGESAHDTTSDSQPRSPDTRLSQATSTEPASSPILTYSPLSTYTRLPPAKDLPSREQSISGPRQASTTVDPPVPARDPPGRQQTWQQARDAFTRRPSVSAKGSPTIPPFPPSFVTQPAPSRRGTTFTATVEPRVFNLQKPTLLSSTDPSSRPPRIYDVRPDSVSSTTDPVSRTASAVSSPRISSNQRTPGIRPVPSVDSAPRTSVPHRLSTVAASEAPSRPPLRPGGGADGEVQHSQYMDMLLALDAVPQLHNLLASFFTWILLAGFVVLPGTFSSLQEIEAANGSANVVLHAIQHISLFVIAYVCCAIGVAGMGWLWWRWQGNYIWLLNKIFVPGTMNGLAGVISTIASVFGAQRGRFTASSITTMSVTGGCTVICGALTVFFTFWKLGRVKQQHEKEVGVELAGKHGEGWLQRARRSVQQPEPVGRGFF